MNRDEWISQLPPLYRAIQLEDIPQVYHLLEQKASPHELNDKANGLHHAVNIRNYELVKLFLSMGVDHYIGNPTPLVLARDFCYDDDPIIKTLEQVTHKCMLVPFLVHLEKTLGRHYLYDKNAFKQVISLSRGRRWIRKSNGRYYLVE